MLKNIKRIENEKSDYPINIKLARLGITGKILGETLGILQKGSFSSKSGASLSKSERNILLKNLKELEQKGYGIKCISKLIKDEPLSNIDINDEMKNYECYKGTMPKDQVKNIQIKNGERFCFVLNLHNTGKPGSHWTACYSDINNSIYFDSYGIIPPKSVVDLFERINRPLFYNNTQYQYVDSHLCAHFCIDFLVNSIESNDPIKVLKTYTDSPSKENQQKVRDRTY